MSFQARIFFPALAIKILISIQKSIYVKVVRTFFFKQRRFFAKLKFKRHSAIVSEVEAFQM